MGTKTDMNADKNMLRKEYLTCRETQGNMARIEKSRQILMKLMNQEAFITAESILIYVDFRGEVITTPLLEELLSNKKKKVYCPKVMGIDMDFYEISDMTELKTGFYGIREPAQPEERKFTAEKYNRNTCLMIMPGVVFDKKRGRVGYGKGYYDRFLAEYPDMKTVALAYDCQIAPEVPMREYDRKPDMIITESDIMV